MNEKDKLIVFVACPAIIVASTIITGFLAPFNFLPDEYHHGNNPDCPTEYWAAHNSSVHCYPHCIVGHLWWFWGHRTYCYLDTVPQNPPSPSHAATVECHGQSFPVDSWTELLEKERECGQTPEQEYMITHQCEPGPNYYECVSS